MKVYKPNDLIPGDVIEHCYGGILLVLRVNKADKEIETVMLSGVTWLNRQPGEKLTTRFTSKQWKRFDPNYLYHSRGWAFITEHASMHRSETMIT